VAAEDGPKHIRCARCYPLTVTGGIENGTCAALGSGIQYLLSVVRRRHNITFSLAPNGILVCLYVQVSVYMNTVYEYGHDNL